MFGFGRRREVEARAKSLGDLLLLLVDSLHSMSLDDFVEANHRRGFVDSYLDRKTREYGFFETQPPQSEFSFHVRYHHSPDGGPEIPTLIVESHHRYYGLAIIGLVPGRIGVDLETIIPARERGRDARALMNAMLKFPGFTSSDPWPP